ncbi:MAG: homocysteine S-methyltransferase family protein [Oscillospiraceae bacterium]
MVPSMETAASVLFFDGAFGTYYYQKTSDDTPCELVCRTNPQLVEQIHREYIQAGAQAIKTNTYAANSLLGPRDDVFALITEAWRIASRAAAGTQTAVFADIGYIPLEPEAAREEYLALARHFLSLGAKNFLFETLAEFSPILPAVLEIRRLCPQACIIASFAVSQDGYPKGIRLLLLLSQVRDTPRWMREASTSVRAQPCWP